MELFINLWNSRISRLTSIVLWLILSLEFASSQSVSDFNFVVLQNNKQKGGVKEYQKLANEQSDAKSYQNLYLLPFIFYKKFLSSQDFNACTFHPSCSEYGLISIRKRGLLIGGLASFDRLSRCHPFVIGNYVYDVERKKFLDP